MGKEVGHKCVRTPEAFLFLAFFSVVASSPNLSTLCFVAAKIQQKVKSEK